MNNKLEYMMWDLQQALNPSEEAVESLKVLNNKSSRTFVGKRILKMQIAVILLLILLIPTAVFAAQSLSQVLFEKTKDAGITEKEMEQVLLYLEETGHTADQIEGFDPLLRNEKGLTYGPEAFGADLILVEMENGEIGYVYEEDILTEGDFVKTPEEALAWNKKSEKLMEKQGYVKKIPVYASDGETIIGVFFIR